MHDKDILYARPSDRKIKYLILDKAISDVQAIASSRGLDSNLPIWELAVAIANHDNELYQSIEEGVQTEIILGVFKGKRGTITKIAQDRKTFLVQLAEDKSYWFYYYEITFIFGADKLERYYSPSIDLEKTGNSSLSQSLKEIFRGDFLREIAIELRGEDPELKYNKNGYITLICVHFDSLADFYIYLARKQLKESDRTFTVRP